MGALVAVLHHSRAVGTDRLVLLSIANRDGGDGCWPTVKTLARLANVDQRSVRPALRRLAASGELVVHAQGGGVADLDPGHLRPDRYEVVVICPANCDRTTEHRPARHTRSRRTESTISPAADGV